jgi:phage gp29-like protein
MCKSYDMTDWMAFAEVYGMPLRLGKYGPGANDEDIQTLVRAVANIGTDAAAVIPRTMDLEFVDGKQSTTGADVFERLADWLDKQVSKAVIGQTMTADDGASLAQGQVHNDVRKDIVGDDARQLSNTLNRDLVRPYIDLNHGPQKRYPRVRLFMRERENLDALSKALAPMIDRGLRVEQSVIRDKFGLPDPADDAELLGPAKSSSAPAPETPPPPAANRVAIHARTAAVDAIDELVADAMREWQPMMDPVLEPLRKAIERATSLQELQDALPKALEGANVDELVRHLAVKLFEARGLGDARDN